MLFLLGEKCGISSLSLEEFDGSSMVLLALDSGIAALPLPLMHEGIESLAGSETDILSLLDCSSHRAFTLFSEVKSSFPVKQINKKQDVNSFPCCFSGFLSVEIERFECHVNQYSFSIKTILNSCFGNIFDKFSMIVNLL